MFIAEPVRRPWMLTVCGPRRGQHHCGRVCEGGPVARDGKREKSRGQVTKDLYVGLRIDQWMHRAGIHIVELLLCCYRTLTLSLPAQPLISVQHVGNIYRTSVWPASCSPHWTSGMFTSSVQCLVCQPARFGALTLPNPVGDMKEPHKTLPSALIEIWLCGRKDFLRCYGAPLRTRYSC